MHAVPEDLKVARHHGWWVEVCCGHTVDLEALRTMLCLRAASALASFAILLDDGGRCTQGSVGGWEVADGGIHAEGAGPHGENRLPELWSLRG